jgi:UDPglucose--hexose-1-phosphate uridylyltransferase
LSPEKKLLCPFCPGNETRGFRELYRVGTKGKNGWQVRVIPNKFPFAPIHEIVIHSPSHESNFFDFSKTQTEKILRVYRERFRLHEGQGQVLIFHNSGKAGGESIPHSHTQITVLPKNLVLEIPTAASPENIFRKSKYFDYFCPCDSRWPSEVWITPKNAGKSFGESTNEEIEDLAKNFPIVLKKLKRVFGKTFSFNFYIYPLYGWYLRIIPREKTLGGFEVSSNIFVNTVDSTAFAKKLGKLY